VPNFSQSSKDFLSKCHPDLIAVCNAAILRIDFKIICSQRGAADQEKAHKEGHSNATFGKSPHNYAPCFAVDVIPYPFNGDWNDKSLVPRLKTDCRRIQVGGRRNARPYRVGRGLDVA
jgi:hypothetical protein